MYDIVDLKSPDEKIKKEIFRICKQCLSFDPDARPDIQQIINAVNTVYKHEILKSGAKAPDIDRSNRLPESTHKTDGNSISSEDLNNPEATLYSNSKPNELRNNRELYNIRNDKVESQPQMVINRNLNFPSRKFSEKLENKPDQSKINAELKVRLEYKADSIRDRYNRKKEKVFSRNIELLSSISVGKDEIKSIDDVGSNLIKEAKDEKKILKNNFKSEKSKWIEDDYSILNSRKDEYFIIFI